MTQTQMASLERNQLMEDLALMVRNDPYLAQRLKNGESLDLGSEFGKKVNQFVEKFGDLLDLERSSYRLRDDDNIYLGKIEAQLLRVLKEAKSRIEGFEHQGTGTTFVIPLAAGVVERRGGMLIHGPIIAREYGLPCVTGIPDATALIHTGDEITVDGYLGIVTILKTCAGLYLNPYPIALKLRNHV